MLPVFLAAVSASLLDIELSVGEKLAALLELKVHLLKESSPISNIENFDLYIQPHLLPELPVNYRAQVDLGAQVVDVDFFVFRSIKQYKQVGNNKAVLACTSNLVNLLTIEGEVVAQAQTTQPILLCRGTLDSRDMRVLVATEGALLFYEVSLMIHNSKEAEAYSTLNLIREVETSGVIAAKYDLHAKNFVVGYSEAVRIYDCEGNKGREFSFKRGLKSLAATKTSVYVAGKTRIWRLFNGLEYEWCEELRLPAEIVSLVASSDHVLHTLLEDESLVTIKDCSPISQIQTMGQSMTTSDSGVYALSSGGYLEHYKLSDLIGEDQLRPGLWQFKGQGSYLISSHEHFPNTLLSIAAGSKVIIFSKTHQPEPDFEDTLPASFVRTLGFLLACLTIAVWRYSKKRGITEEAINEVVQKKHKLERKIKEAQHMQNQIKRRMEKQRFDIRRLN